MSSQYSTVRCSAAAVHSEWPVAVAVHGQRGAGASQRLRPAGCPGHKKNPRRTGGWLLDPENAPTAPRWPHTPALEDPRRRGITSVDPRCGIVDINYTLSSALCSTSTPASTPFQHGRASGEGARLSGGLASHPQQIVMFSTANHIRPNLLNNTALLGCNISQSQPFGPILHNHLFHSNGHCSEPSQPYKSFHPYLQKQSSVLLTRKWGFYEHLCLEACSSATATAQDYTGRTQGLCTAKFCVSLHLSQNGLAFLRRK